MCAVKSLPRSAGEEGDADPSPAHGHFQRQVSSSDPAIVHAAAGFGASILELGQGIPCGGQHRQTDAPGDPSAMVPEEQCVSGYVGERAGGVASVAWPVWPPLPVPAGPPPGWAVPGMLISTGGGAAPQPRATTLGNHPGKKRVTIAAHDAALLASRR